MRYLAISDMFSENNDRRDKMIEYKKKINERLKFIVQSEFIKPLFPQQFEQYGKTRIKSAKKTGFL